MTVKKPAFIYSVIVETLKACRTKERGAGCSLEDKVDTYTAAVIITMCKDAVEERRDIRDFRKVCERRYSKPSCACVGIPAQTFTRSAAIG